MRLLLELPRFSAYFSASVPTDAFGESERPQRWWPRFFHLRAEDGPPPPLFQLWSSDLLLRRALYPAQACSRWEPCIFRRSQDSDCWSLMRYTSRSRWSLTAPGGTKARARAFQSGTLFPNSGPRHLPRAVPHELPSLRTWPKLLLLPRQ